MIGAQLGIPEQQEIPNRVTQGVISDWKSKRLHYNHPHTSERGVPFSRDITPVLFTNHRGL